MIGEAIAIGFPYPLLTMRTSLLEVENHFRGE